jgi:hypothetical protein
MIGHSTAMASRSRTVTLLLLAVLSGCDKHPQTFNGEGIPVDCTHGFKQAPIDTA